MIHTVNSINWVKYIHISGQYGPVVCSILLFILSL